LENARNNTARYWKNNQKNRIAESFADLLEENSRSPKRKVFKKYKNPVSTAIDSNRTLNLVKRQTNDIREKIRNK
jgi:hypothetical protein